MVKSKSNSIKTANRNSVFFLPLGGCNEIGMNLNMYQYNGKWIIVDMGVTFEKKFGMEVVMPDISFIKKIKKDLLAIVLTHAHEDHLGALPYLWNEIRCPVYATPFASYIAREKMKQVGLANEMEINIVPLKGGVKIGDFDIEYVTLTHSIAEPNALAIKTPAGVIMHTGDWKIDPTPLVGEATDIKRLKEIGKKGVMALVCDSTNIYNEGRSGSELEVRENLTKIVSTMKKRVIVTCFASNIARLETVALAAKANGRKVVMAGRSIERMEEAARVSGYLKDTDRFMKAGSFSSLKPEETMLLCTGSQGEDRAALWRIAHGDYPGIKLDAGDTVLFSSREIPGNENEIKALQNALLEKGVVVVNSRKEFIHVSGHPYQDELRDMYEWTKPTSLIPVHGEQHHIKRHAMFGKECGIKNTIAPYNGSLIEINKSGVKIIGNEGVGRLALDGMEVVDYNSEHFKERAAIADNGIISVTLVVGTAGTLFAKPQITFVGISNQAAEKDLRAAIVEVVHSTLQSVSRDDITDNETVKVAMVKAIKRATKIELGKRPIITVHLVRLKEKSAGDSNNSGKKKSQIGGSALGDGSARGSKQKKKSSKLKRSKYGKGGG